MRVDKYTMFSNIHNTLPDYIFIAADRQDLVFKKILKLE